MEEDKVKNMEEKIENNTEKETMEIPQKFNNATQKYEPDLEALEKKVEEMKKEQNHSKEVEVREKEIEKQEEMVKKVESEEPSPKDDSGEPKSIKDDKAGKKKEGSFMPMILIMVVSLLIASMWDRVPAIKDSVHFVLNPSAGMALDWNLNFGMLIIVLIITALTTLVQKYATDQDTLKELKKEQKELQKQMKEFKEHPKKLMELQKKQFKLMPKQMKLSMRAIVYTGVPFILFFRWFRDYFMGLEAAGEPFRLWLGMSWFLFYIIASIGIGAILRKRMDVV